MATKNILAIDDDRTILETLRISLEIENYTVATASNGKEGLEALRKIKGGCVVLLDLMMPYMNGWEFIAALKQDGTIATPPIIVLTAFADAAKGLSVSKVLRKPFDLDELLDAIKEASGETP